MHEMLHVYFTVWCRDDTHEARFEPDQDEGHGVIYITAARRIERKVAAGLTSHREDFEDPMNPLAMQGVPLFCGDSR